MAEKKDFRKTYAELEKKHRLPGFDHLDLEFEISSIDETNYPLREIRRKLHDKIDFACKLLDSVLQPEAVWHNMYEAGIFQEEEKKNLYLLYKELMSYNRTCTLLEIQPDALQDAKLIREFSEAWKSKKQILADAVAKIRDGWKKEANIEEERGYFG